MSAGHVEHDLVGDEIAAGLIGRDLAAKLAREGRQGSIALKGDILMLVDGQRVLVKAPAPQP